MRALRARRLCGVLACACATLAAVSCSLDLDEALITQRPEAGLPDGDLPDGALGDAGGDGTLPSGPDAATCEKDDDCKATHPCLKGKCDLERNACVYDVCRNAACSAAACATSTQACGQPATYKYRASSFPVGAQVAARLAAAVHPYLFLGTGNGVVAFNVANPAATNPQAVPVVGLGFVPTQFVASGSRVYFLSTPVGGNPSRLPLAWIDVPADPFATKLVAHSVLPTFGRPAGEGVNLFARGNDSALVVRIDPMQSFPTAFFTAPLVEPITINTSQLTFTQNTTPVAVSGSRLVMRGANNNVFSFGLIQNAGAPNAQNLGDTAMADAGQVSTPEQYAQSADGAVLWAIHTLQQVPNPPNPPVTRVRSLRAYFLLANGTANVDQAAGIDVELYDAMAVGPGGAQLGPSALLDSKTGMLVHAARENLAQTAVQFVTREPLGVVKEGANPKRVVLPFQANQVAAAVGSNGIGYVIANDVAGPPPNATVYVFDPACAP